jgi:hypothetical protein
MAAVYVTNIVINSGATFSQDFFLEDSSTNSPMNLGFSTITSQMRKWSGSVGVTTFTTSIVDSNTGHIRIGLGNSITSTLKPGRYVYDILVTNTSDSTSKRAVEGMVLVREGVTR